MDTLKINCRICGGIRPVSGTRCGGCASPIENCANRGVAKKKHVPECPKCHGRRALQVVPERWICQGCHAVFERDDFGFLDDRPDVNMDKKERQQRFKKRRA